ncbi:neural cell adhesion molecule 2-like [Lycodopsis pacificus]
MKKGEGLTFRNLQEFRNGETAEVVCAVIGSPVPVVTWYYQDEEITEEHHSKFTVLPNNNLQIRQVTKADEGVYRCEAIVDARGKNPFVDIAVVVNVPPVLSVFQPSLNAIADQESVIFICMTTGSPEPVVTWHRKGRELEPSEQYNIRLDGGRSMLTVRNIRQVDGGSYTCKATNKAGSQEREIVLKVFDIPKFLTNQTVYYSWEGNPVNISCEVMSNPPATMLWRRERLTISVEGTANTRVYSDDGKSVLEVTPMSDRDFGRYNCTARNNIGIGYQEFFLAQAVRS